MRRYTDEERTFLREIVPGHSFAVIAETFNAKFENPITVAQVKSFVGNNKLNTGRTGHFPKGNVPFNKGMKIYWTGGEATRFKKGQAPVNHRPVGSSRVNADGYTEIKVSEPNKWRSLHVVTWEESNGSVPKDCVIIFGDGNKQNTTLENLILVTRAELVMLNKFKLIGASAELTKTGVLVADLRMKLHKNRVTETDRMLIQKEADNEQNKRNPGTGTSGYAGADDSLS